MRHELSQWLVHPTAAGFPLAEVIAAFRRVGKHFVPPDLLALLAEARAKVPQDAPALRRFLDTALDKHDGRFDNPSYLAIHDLPLPHGPDTTRAEAQRDRLVMLLVADLLRFEIDALDGTTDLLPQLRPDARTVAKRCALGLIALRTAMRRQGLDTTSAETDAIAAARELIARVEADQSAEERRMLAVTLLTVSTIHDENLFVRVLQAYEATFSLIVVELTAAIEAIEAGSAPQAARALRAAEQAMSEASPLFSLVATMQSEAFMTFREFTDGASAIQSRSYKAMEALCRRPDPERLSGPGFDAAPEVRERVIAGQPTIEGALALGGLSADERAFVEAAMEAFEAAVLAWRKTHHNLAMRMLGSRRGTGYTAGVPYLAHVKAIPLFKAVGAS